MTDKEVFAWLDAKQGRRVAIGRWSDTNQDGQVKSQTEAMATDCGEVVAVVFGDTTEAALGKLAKKLESLWGK